MANKTLEERLFSAIMLPFLALTGYSGSVAESVNTLSNIMEKNYVEAGIDFGSAGLLYTISVLASISTYRYFSKDASNL